MYLPLIVKNITKQKAPHIRNGFPYLRGFHFVNRGRGPKYTVPCPKGRPRRTRRQGEDAERRRAQKDISGPAVHADGGTGGRHSPLLSDGGMVGQRRPRDVYKMRLQIGVHNGAFCCSGTLMKRRKFNGGKRCRLAFHAVDRGSNPLGDAKEIKPLRVSVRAFSLWGKSAPLPTPQIEKNFSGSQRHIFPIGMILKGTHRQSRWVFICACKAFLPAAP